MWWFIGGWLASAALIPVLWFLGSAGRGATSGLAEQGRAPALAELRSTAAVKSAHVGGRLRPAIVSRLLRLTEHRLGAARTAARPNQAGLYVISALVGIGVLILLFVAPFSDSVVTEATGGVRVPVARMPVAGEAGPVLSPSEAAQPARPAELSVKPLRGAAASEGVAAPADPPLDQLTPEETKLVAAIEARPDDVADRAGEAARHPVNVATGVPVSLPLLGVPDHRTAPGVQRGPGHHRAQGPSVIRPYATGSSRGTWLSNPNPNAGSNS
jgi:hypothetical protein